MTQHRNKLNGVQPVKPGYVPLAGMIGSVEWQQQQKNTWVMAEQSEKPIYIQCPTCNEEFSNDKLEEAVKLLKEIKKGEEADGYDVSDIDEFLKRISA